MTPHAWLQRGEAAEQAVKGARQNSAAIRMLNTEWINRQHGWIDPTICFECESLPALSDGVFQGCYRVNRLTMPLFSRPAALDPRSTTRYRSALSYVFDLTTVPAFSLWLVRTAHVAGPGPDGPILDAAQSV
jgi:hypothetical protein